MRKFLAILLTMCMLSTLVVMPVSAETVTLTDPNTVLTVPDDGVVFDEIGDSVSFTINVTETAVYDLKTRINFTSAVKRQIAPAWYVDDVLLTTGFRAKGDYYPGETLDVSAGDVWLTAGEHTVKVENFLGEYKVIALLINKTDKAKDEVSTDFLTYAGIGGEWPMVSTDGNYTITTDGTYPAWIRMNDTTMDEIHTKVGIREAGFYSVEIEIEGAGNIANDNNFKLKTTLGSATETVTIKKVDANTPIARGTRFTLISSVALNAGTYDLDIVKAGDYGYYGYFDEITVTKIPFEVENVKANGTIDFENGNTIIRGADTFEVDVNFDVAEASVTETTVFIKNDNTDEIVSAEVSAAEDKITINLKETLEYGTTYSLNFDGVTDNCGLGCTLPSPIIFTTVTEESNTDAGDGTVTVTSKTLVGNIVTISGTVLSSAGLPIAGRTVKVRMTTPAGVVNEEAAYDVTDENGAFEISIILPTEGNNISGPYQFIVRDDYVTADEPYDPIYVAEETRNAIVSVFDGEVSALEVNEMFEVYDFAWGANYPDDLLNVLEDLDPENEDKVAEAKTLFLNHFVNYEAENVEEVKEQYDFWLKFETLNQTNAAGTVSTILASSEDCAAFGLDKAAIDLIVTNKSDFEAAVAALAKQTSLEAYQTEFAKVLNEYLAIELDKTAVALSTSNATGYPGQGATFSYKFASALSDVVGVKIDVVSASSDITVDENSVAVALEGATYDVTSIPSGVSVLIEAADALEFDNETTIFTVSVTSPSAVGSYSIKTSGVVTYVSGTTNYTTDIPETTATLTVTAAPSYSGGGGGASSTTKPVEDTKSEEMDLESGTEEPGTDEPGTDEPGTDAPSTGDFKFNDIESVDWAAESINSLLDKGIISKSEDGKFNPNNEVTREEFVKMMVVAMGVYDENAASNLKDVDKNEWYAAYVASAEKAGLISGNDDGTFGVGDEISREDMSVIIYRAMAKLGLIEAAPGGDFADDSEISDYAKEAVYALKSLGILNGVGNNKFAPQGTATRAMAAKVIYEMLEGISK